MEKPVYPILIIALASTLAVPPLAAFAQQGSDQHHHEQPPRKPPQRPQFSGPQPGPAHSPPQSGRHLNLPAGGGPSPQGVRYAHHPLPSHDFGGHVYHGHLGWEHGRWHHEMRNGRYGWWWDVDGAWYFYPQPIVGPPPYVSDIEVVIPDGPDSPLVEGDYPPPDETPYPPPEADDYPPPPPPPPPPGQETVGSAIGGAILGGIVGGALTGRPAGAAAGAIVGGATGAAIGAEAEQRHAYYWWQDTCYYRYPSGAYAPIDPRYCY